MRVFGIDPGSRILGYGVVEGARGRPVHVAHGVVRVDGALPLEKRLLDIHAELTQLLALYRPDAVAVEGVFTCRNVRSALILGHARGVALLTAAQTGAAVFEYAPARVKRSVGAGGAGAKEGVARMVQRLLAIQTDARADATDALAVALCHLHQAGSPQSQPATSRGGRRPGPRLLLADRLSASYRAPEGKRAP